MLKFKVFQDAKFFNLIFHPLESCALSNVRPNLKFLLIEHQLISQIRYLIQLKGINPCPAELFQLYFSSLNDER